MEWLEINRGGRTEGFWCSASGGCVLVLCAALFQPKQETCPALNSAEARDGAGSLASAFKSLKSQRGARIRGMLFIVSLWAEHKRDKREISSLQRMLLRLESMDP